MGRRPPPPPLAPPSGTVDSPATSTRIRRDTSSPSITKVKAHVDPRTVADDPVLLTHALGNATADAAAEAAALRHPPWDPDAQQELDSPIERITFTLRIAALVLALRKSARHFHYQRLPTDRDVTMLPLNVAAPPPLLPPPSITAGSLAPTLEHGNAATASQLPAEAPPLACDGAALARASTAPSALC